MHKPFRRGTTERQCCRAGTGGGQTCRLRARRHDCRPKHPSPDLPRLVRLTRGLRPGCCQPSEARGAGSAGLETLGSHRRGLRPFGLPRRACWGQPCSLQPGEARPGAGRGKAGTGCFGRCFGCAVERALIWSFKMERGRFVQEEVDILRCQPPA